MERNSKSTENTSGPAERPLIDAAWAQFETLARQKSTSTDPSRSFTVPGYRVLHEIHRGGQGVVYQALQESTRRKVAIKVLKDGPLADESELARFDREVDVLSRLNHPHIVAIHDRGLTAGHAYYVMDYIPGRSLDAYVAGAGLSTKETLKLFRQVCEAVNIAHLRGVIHRDLKPSNIRIDEDGEPRVLDFGLAKMATDASWSAAAMTMTGQFVGSLPWASPEQAEGRSELLDIRTDVYSLGVILYQLLTGSFPYLVSGPMSEVVRSIIHESPTRPSTIVPTIDRDVEIIVLKCLAKEPERRYQSAGELARDIQRYLDGEPIEARPASSLYQFRQFARRNQAMIGAFAAVIAALLLGTIGSVVGLVRATQAEQIAVRRSEESLQAAARAAAVNNFLQEMLSSVNPMKSMGKEITIRLALDEAAAKIDSGTLKTQPGIEADLRSTIGSTYLALGHYSEAEHHLLKAVALRPERGSGGDSALAMDLNYLADVANAQGRFTEQERLMREVLAILRRLHSGDHADLAGAYQGLAASLRRQNKFVEAERNYRSGLEMRRRLFGPEHEDVAQSLNSLALLKQNQNDLDAAEKLFREALAMRRKVLGETHPTVADALANLGNFLKIRGNYEEPESLHREALEIRRKVYGSEHPIIAESMNNLGGFLIDKQNYGKNDKANSDALIEAEALYRDALAIWRKTLPPNHPNISFALNGLGILLNYRKEYVEAESVFRECLTIIEARTPLAERSRLRAWSGLGESLTGRGKYEEAEPYLLKTVKELKKNPNFMERGESMTLLINLYNQWNRPEDAARWEAELLLKPSD